MSRLVRGLLGLLIVVLVLAGCGRSAQLIGTPLDGVPAPDFRLTNQSGESVSLSGLRGKVVVLGFLYTSCPDSCPFTAQKLGRARDELGGRGQDAAFVLVSVDPERDDVERVRRYLEAQGLEEKLLYLTGDAAKLERVWASYYIGVEKGPATGATTADPGSYEVGHSESLYLIDKAGRERSLMDEEIAPAELMRNLRVLLRE